METTIINYLDSELLVEFKTREEDLSVGIHEGVNIKKIFLNNSPQFESWNEKFKCINPYDDVHFEMSFDQINKLFEWSHDYDEEEFKHIHSSEFCEKEFIPIPNHVKEAVKTLKEYGKTPINTLMEAIESIVSFTDNPTDLEITNLFTGEEINEIEIKIIEQL